MKKKYVIPSLIVAFFYLATLCGIGLFGSTAMWFVRLVAPYFLAFLGLCVVVALPYRIMWAIDRNNEIKRKIEEERRMALAAERNKKMVDAAKRYEMGDMV
jgi:hypothetical protein